MTHKPTQPHTPSNQSSLADCVMRRIETECITPTPRWQFVFSEYMVWLLWLLSVVVGALSVAVMLYVSLHASYALYEATHETVWEFIIEAAPFLWLGVFLLMSAVAYFNLRHTKKGYRYPVSQILLSSLLLSLLGGSVLHAVGAGYVADSFMHQTMPLYASFEARELRWWQQPESGMLVGRLTLFVPEHEYVFFADIEKHQWRLNISELSPAERDLLQSGGVVKIIGMQSTSSAELFHGCGVFPWLHERDRGIADMRHERSEFMEKMNTFKQKIAERFATSSELAAPSSTHLMQQLLPMPICASMPLMKKMP